MRSQANHRLPPGFRSRPASMDDLEATVDLFNDCSQAYIGARDFTVEDNRSEWQSPGFDVEASTQAAFSPDGRLVGIVEVWDNLNPPVHPFLWIRVHPDFEGMGIGSYLLAWGEKRAREALDRAPVEARVSMRSGDFSTFKFTGRRLEADGWELIRHNFQMLIEMDSPPPEPRWPEGILLRAFDAQEDTEAIYRVDVEAFRDHFGYVERPFEEGFEHFKHHLFNDTGYDPDLWFLAVDGEEVAGMSLCRKWSHEDPETGWVTVLAVRQPWRRRGIALALLQHSFGEYYRRGFRKVALGVDAENLTGALDLYRKAGMHVHRQFDVYEKELRSGIELSVVSLEE